MMARHDSTCCIIGQTAIAVPAEFGDIARREQRFGVALSGIGSIASATYAVSLREAAEQDWGFQAARCRCMSGQVTQPSTATVAHAPKTLFCSCSMIPFPATTAV